jgi:predicted XRE-type DNA-binding protein
MDIKVTPSTGNVFRDVGFSRSQAERLKVRSDLLSETQDVIRKRGLTQTAAAKLLGVHPPRVSDLMRGRIDLFSIETLIDMLSRLGLSVNLVTAGRELVMTSKAADASWLPKLGDSLRSGTSGTVSLEGRQDVSLLPLALNDERKVP